MQPREKPPRDNDGATDEGATAEQHTRIETALRLGSDLQTDSMEYWRESANTLSNENAALTDQLTQIKAENACIRESMSRAMCIQKELERRIAEADREITQLSLLSRHGGGGVVQMPHIQTTALPVNVDLDGQDAMYWYQTCRTMEAQFAEREAESRRRINELMEILSAKRKRDHITPSSSANQSA